MTSIKDTTLLIIKTLKISTSLYKLPLKLFNSKLNLKPYNKLSKEVDNFKD